jgi:ATP-dependent RNA helicase DeaD
VSRSLSFPWCFVTVIEEQEPPASSTSAPAPTRFDELGLSDAMLAALAEAGYLQPTPVQAGLIPRALAEVDVMGQARTGTGKTAAFVIPILERLQSRKERHGPQALVLVPTRELAVQVRGEVEKLSHGRRFHCVALYGGKPIRGQIEKLNKGAEVVIGTPGRVLDHLGRGTLELGNLTTVVLDEADRMLDIGFRPDIEKILRKCPQSRQTLLLSATVPPPVERLARRYMRDPEKLDFSPGEISVETIEQFYFTVSPDRKGDLLVRLIRREEPKQAIVFCRTKRGTDKVFRALSKKFEGVDCIHGDLQQRARDRVMEQFREGKVRLLVATDVVGRGIDVSGISHIINYDIPEFCDDYVHRVGRTGRMGREGVAYSFVTPEQGNELTRIEMRIDKLLRRAEIEGFDPIDKPAPTMSAAELAKGGMRPDSAYDDLPEGENGAAGEAAKPAPPKVGRGGRPIRRLRKAL